MLTNKEIKNKIKSGKSVKKITKSMQMISVVKVQRINKRIKRVKEYFNESCEILNKFEIDDTLTNPLLSNGEGHNTLVVVITSDRGLVGSYNSRVLSEVSKYINTHDSLEKLSIFAIGRKAYHFGRKNGVVVSNYYKSPSDKVEYDQVKLMANNIVREFLTGEFKKVVVFYTKYINSFTSSVENEDLLPISFERNLVEDSREDEKLEFDLEPSKEALLDYILPKLIEIRLFELILQSSASEHSSRMIAMKNSTDAANEFIKSMTFELNKNRQSQVTREVSEITSGIQSIRKKRGDI